MQTITITGGSGLIGATLSRLLVQKGYRVIVLSRQVKPPKGNISYASWDPKNQTMDKSAIQEADHIVHLAGAGVAEKRWTKKRKKEILDSRVMSSQLIVKALTETTNTVQSVVSASAIGWYGADKKPVKPFVESDPASGDFLGQTCARWEESIQPVTLLGKRLAILRTGIVLSNAGGAYKEFIKPMKAGVAGILGSGKQFISWIHIDDMCRMYLAAIENPNLMGVYNAVSPDPVTNKELIVQMAKARKQPYIPIHVPGFSLRILLGEMSVEVLKSTTVNNSRIRNSGFNFLYPSLKSALNALVKEV